MKTLNRLVIATGALCTVGFVWSCVLGVWPAALALGAAAAVCWVASEEP